MSDEALKLFLQQAQVGALLIFLQNYLKKSKWFTLLNYEKEKANHYFAIVASLLATVGIHFTFNSQDHSLLITGLSLSNVAIGTWHWITQYIFTKVGYVALKDNLNPSETVVIPTMKGEVK